MNSEGLYMNMQVQMKAGEYMSILWQHELAYL